MVARGGGDLVSNNVAVNKEMSPMGPMQYLQTPDFVNIGGFRGFHEFRFLDPPKEYTLRTSNFCGLGVNV